MKITTEMLKTARTLRGGFKQRQIEVAKSITGSGPSNLVGMELADEDWKRFINAGRILRKKKVKVLNPMSRKDGWSWKPEPSDIPAIKTSGKKKKHKIVESGAKRKGFYESGQWLELRYRVLRKHGARCMACGRNPKDHGVVIHVDHIKPRSKFPELELVFENLQILCMDCNIGKGNKDQTDWRSWVCS